MLCNFGMAWLHYTLSTCDVADCLFAENAYNIVQKPDIAWKAASYTHAPNFLSPSIQLIAVDCWFFIGGVCMSDDRTSTAQKYEGPSGQQAPAKRVRYMGTSDLDHQTQDTAVSAAHAEPGGSTTHSPEPAAAAAARCATPQPYIASNNCQYGSETFCRHGFDCVYVYCYVLSTCLRSLQTPSLGSICEGGRQEGGGPLSCLSQQVCKSQLQCM